MKKTVVIDVVGLSSHLIGDHTPFFQRWRHQGSLIHINPVLPAVTCTCQSTYLTNKWPYEHGIVGNGWYFRDECDIKFWRQSNKLVQATKIWEIARKKDSSFTCANMFWWYNMYSSVDYSVTPRPNYLADGRKIPDVYSHPSDLRDKLQRELGQFPLFDFWGPKTSIKSSQWIADASKIIDQLYAPTLTLIYLPHLDYNLQRCGLDFSKIGQDLQKIDLLCENLIQFYENRGAQVIILSEYGITNVSRPVALNRTLRKHGYLEVRREQGLELLDPGASRAFAVADHQIAHIYLNDPEIHTPVRDLITNVEGVEKVLGNESEKTTYHLNHQRAGDLIALADKDSWFTYYYWLDNTKAPDFARTVDIHRKPGYDPLEMFTDPQIKFLVPLVATKLIKKKLGFRVLMDIIPLDASLIKGSHGRLPESKKDWPILLTSKLDRETKPEIAAINVYDILLKCLEA